MSEDIAQADFMNPDLPVDRRAEDLVGRMTLEEKVSQMVYTAPAIERLGVAEHNWWNECLHGVGRAGKATVFPQAIGMAASFNPVLLRRVAEAISDEARAKHHEGARQGNRGQYFGLSYWSPNINIFRDPRWGRGHETYGEDPYLTSRMGVAFVKGLQGDHPRRLKVVATPKHFAVHSGPEGERHRFDARVSARDLRETYLPAFEACVKEGRAGSVMGAYNRVNGEPCCASPTLLGRILREEWKFEGYVVSDCHAIRDFHEHHKVTSSAPESAALAVKEGCDLNCGAVYHHLLAAVEQGRITEADIDVAIQRLMAARIRLGMFDPPERLSYARIPPERVNCEDHRRLARQMARESLVLLENDGTLPLRKDLRGVAVIGPAAFDLEVLLGNYNGYAPRMTTILEGILGVASPGTKVTYAKGCEFAGDERLQETRARRCCEEVDAVVAVLGLTPELEAEGGDRTDIDLPGRQRELIHALCDTGKPVVVVLTGGSPLALGDVADRASAILMAWYPGEAGGEAVAEALFGEVNPAGRLPVTFPRSLDQVPPFEDYSMKGRTYRFMEETPLYRFGYGLSYTTFAYSNLRLAKPEIGKDETTLAMVDVENTGRRPGDEVAQIYLRDVASTYPVPRLRLAGFERIHLYPGERRTLMFAVAPEALVCYDDEGRALVEPGEFEVSVGGGQPDDPASGAVTETLTVR